MGGGILEVCVVSNSYNRYSLARRNWLVPKKAELKCRRAPPSFDACARALIPNTENGMGEMGDFVDRLG